MHEKLPRYWTRSYATENVDPIKSHRFITYSTSPWKCFPLNIFHSTLQASIEPFGAHSGDFARCRNFSLPPAVPHAHCSSQAFKERMARLERDYINATRDFESEKTARRLAQEQAEMSIRKLQSLEQSIASDKPKLMNVCG